MTFNNESRLGRYDKVISTDIGMGELSDELFGEPASCQGPQPNGRYLEAAGPDGSHAHVHPPRPRSP